MTKRDKLLIGVTLLAVLLAIFLPAMPQPREYHDFVDKRVAYGIENFFDVVSNTTFETLFWDRLPMTIAFMSLVSAQLVDRISVRAGLLALVPALLVGVGTVVYWIVTERQGRGNVMPYVVLQAYAVFVLLQLAALHPSRYTHGNAIFVVFACYLLAKVLEHYDRQIFELTGMVSGHTLKHVVAGLAGFPVAYLLWHRRLITPTQAPVDVSPVQAPEQIAY